MDGLTLALIKALGGSGGAGSPGKSAYEIAVENGFEGTEQEWLESLAGEAAGFGSPTASAIALTSGEQPTAIVSASGENTAKVFDFRFGIPAGADGKTPVKGVDYYTDTDKQEIVEDVLASIPISNNNIVIVEIPELVTEKSVTVTDEQLALLSSENAVVYIKVDGSLIPRRVINEKQIFFDTFVSGGSRYIDETNNILEGIKLVTIDINIQDKLASVSIAISKTVPPASLSDGKTGYILASGANDIPEWVPPTCPKPQSDGSDNDKFLKVVDGVPTWTSLPIYNGEVE